MKQRIFIFILLAICVVSLRSPAEETYTEKQFLSVIQKENLNLKSESAAVEASQNNAVGIALPPPMLGSSQIHDESGNASGFEISQTIPFPSKLFSDHNARTLEAEAQKLTEKVAQREVLSEAHLVYFSLWQSQERKSLLEQKKNALKDHIQLATAAARSDSFLKIHLIKAESDLDLLENEISSSELDLREKQIQWAQMMNRSAVDFNPVATEPPLSELPPKDFLKSSYQLEALRLRAENLRSRESEATSSWLPDLNLRYREMTGTPMNPRYTEFMIGASLPFLFFWEPKSATSKARAERIRGELQWELEKRKIETQQVLLFTKALSLRKQLSQFTEKLLPRAEKRMHLVHNLAPRDMETLQDHRETIEAFPELKLKALEVRRQYEETVAQLQKFSSEEIK